MLLTPTLKRLGLIVLTLFLPLTLLRANVTASLLSSQQTLQPGQPVTVALRLVHAPHWHTYWLNAGTGYPTKLTWQLPAGWTAGEIQWPVPSVIKDAQGNVTGNGYEGDLLLPVTLTPPANLAPGETVALAAKAEWLMCAESCVPGEANVSLALPVSADAPPPNPTYTAILEKLSFPKTSPLWQINARRRTDTLQLTLTGPAARLRSPHFFCADELTAYDAAQTVTPRTPDLVEITIPLSPSYTGDFTRLNGVLSYRDDDNRLQGLLIATDLAIAKRPDATADLNPTTSTQLPTPSAPNPKPGTPNSKPEAPAAASARGLLPTLALAFVGGLILNLMPCVFPVLGIKILGFVNQAGSDRRKVTLHGLVFTAGVLVSFWALAALLAVLRAGGDQLGWGFQLQSPGFVFVLATVMLVFAMSMSGVFEFGLRATGVGATLQMKDGLGGSFFTGVLATVVATPCSAPFLAPALGAALTLSPLESFAIFTTIALGLSAPYLTLSLFPAAIKALPRPGAWMETFKQAMAFPLYATVGFLVWILAGQLTDTSLLNALLGLTLIAMAVWLYGRYTAPGAKPARVRFGLIGGAALLVAGGLLGWPRPAAPTDITWEKWTPAAVAAARAEGKTVYVDFTARWCATCQTNKRVVFTSADVKKLFHDRGIVALKADWTNRDPAITAELAKFGRSAVPFNLVYKPGAAEPLVLPELLTPATVLDALR